MNHRTALITAGSIAAVVFAGAIAVGANLGILTVADSTPAGVGQLTAATVVPSSPPVQRQKPAAARTADSQKYIIRKAGAVKVAFSKHGVRLVDVSARRHWKWELAQSVDKRLTVTFRRGSDTYDVHGGGRPRREAHRQGRPPDHASHAGCADGELDDLDGGPGAESAESIALGRGTAGRRRGR